MASEEEVKHLVSKKEQVQAELAIEKVSKAAQEVQLQNISKELRIEVSVLQREVAIARELEEKEWELEEWRLKNVSHNKKQRDLQKTVSKLQGTSETLKKGLSVLTKREEALCKELHS